MRNTWTSLACCLALYLVLSGCGESGGQASKSSDTIKGVGPPPGEVVVEPSSTALMPGGDPSLGVLADLLAGDTLVVPEGYSVTMDDAFDEPKRLRFVVEPNGGAEGGPDDEAVKQAAADVYAALESAFRQRSQQALRAGVDKAAQDATSAGKRVSELQQTIKTYLQSRQGLRATEESRKKRRYYKIMMDSALETQITEEQELKKLRRWLDRGQSIRLRRVR